MRAPTASEPDAEFVVAAAREPRLATTTREL
jgi:hypothetical protein